MTAPASSLNEGLLADLSSVDSAALLENVFDLVVAIQLPDLQLQFVSRSGRNLLHLGPHETVAHLSWSGFVSPATWQTLRVHGLRAVRAGRAWRGSGVILSRHGMEIPVRLCLLPGSGAETGKPIAILTAIDDSRVLNMQTVLRNEQLLLHALLGTTLPDAIYFKDRDSRFTRANAALAKRLGLSSPDQLIGQTDAAFFSAEHAGQARADEERIITTGEAMIDTEEKETWPDGRVSWVSTSKFPLRDWRGMIVGSFGISRDITERKLAEAERQRMEGQLFLAQKMESIGRLAAGVAHEINTPTQYIADNTYFLVGAFAQLRRVIEAYRAVRDGAAAHSDCAAATDAAVAAETETEIDYLLCEIPRTLDQSIDGISRVARIVRSLREFSHPNAPEKRPADLNQAIETAVAVSRHEWKLVADVVTELDPHLPPVPCVLDEFNQVMLNLIVNSAHAISDVVAAHPGERGRITLRTRRDGDWAVIDVADTGTGIPEQARRHIFEPFFTTKPLGHGTGQGLALVHTMVVKNHHGTIEFTTETDRGTTFHLRLPMHVQAGIPKPTTSDEPVHLP